MIYPAGYPKPGLNLHDHASIRRAAAAVTRDRKRVAQEEKEAHQREILMGRASAPQPAVLAPSASSSGATDPTQGRKRVRTGETEPNESPFLSLASDV